MQGSIKLLVAEGAELPSGQARLHFDADHTQIYEDGWMVS